MTTAGALERGRVVILDRTAYTVVGVDPAYRVARNRLAPPPAPGVKLTIRRKSTGTLSTRIVDADLKVTIR